MNDAVHHWEGLVDLLHPAGSLIAKTWAPDDPAMQAEVSRQLLMNVALGYFIYFQSDPLHPDWLPFLNSVFLLQPNPDDTYFLSRVAGERRYRISGNRGSVHLLTFVTGAGMMGIAEKPGQGFDQYDADDLQIGAEGSFEVLMSAQRPADHSGNWWRLDPRADYIMARQRSYRWGEETDARFAIECVGVTAPKPRMSAAAIMANGRELLGGFTPRLTEMWLEFQNALRSRGMINRFEFADFGNIGSIQIQRYWQCIFELEVGEALILETDLPKTCKYWNVQLNDPLFNAVEYIYRQSSLNGAQARIDADGRFRAVISFDDPGVANWLDPGEFRSGTVMGRWYAADSHPLPSLKRVAYRDLRMHLPANDFAVAPDERAAQLAARVRGAQLRRRW